MIVEGSFNVKLFIEFINSLLEKMNSFFDPRSVVVMNNCSIHKSFEIEELTKMRCASFMSSCCTSLIALLKR